MNIAVIDIGTNTVLLLVAHIDASGAITPLACEQRVPRLGKDVDDRKNLDPESMQRVVNVLSGYRDLIGQFDVVATVVAGTSAVRDARNKEEFAFLINQQTGFDLEVLSGNDEALLTYRGGISGIPSVHHATVVDIGGGSTEVSAGTGTTITRRTSIDVGSVRLTERYFRHDPPSAAELRQAETALASGLEEIREFHRQDAVLIGVAGTATSLAILDQGLKEFSIDAVSGYRLQRTCVERLCATLETMNAAEILALSAVMEGRSDVMIAGAMILRGIMQTFGTAEILVSERGVRYGLALREWERRNR